MSAIDRVSTEEKNEASTSASMTQDVPQTGLDGTDQAFSEDGISWLSMTQTLRSKDNDGRKQTVKDLSRSPRKSRPPKDQFEEQWALWLWESDQAELTYPNRGTLSKLGTFGTTCDFWAVFNGIKRVSSMARGSEYYLFKESFDPTLPRPIRPDEGHWIACYDPTHHEAMDRYWMMTIIAITEGKLQGYGETLLGAGLAIREKGDVITVWTRRNTGLEKPRKGLGDMLRMVLGAKKRFRYISHQGI